MVQGCWLGGKAALISGSATEEGTQVRAKEKPGVPNTEIIFVEALKKK